MKPPPARLSGPSAHEQPADVLADPQSGNGPQNATQPDPDPALTHLADTLARAYAPTGTIHTTTHTQQWRWGQEQT